MKKKALKGLAECCEIPVVMQLESSLNIPQEIIWKEFIAGYLIKFPGLCCLSGLPGPSLRLFNPVLHHSGFFYSAFRKCQSGTACYGPFLVHNWTMDVPEPFFEQRFAIVMRLFIINLHGNTAPVQAACELK